MAGTITAGAVDNIHQAAAEAGIPEDRVITALERVPQTVTWNDGSLTGSAAELKTALVQILVAEGISENKAELFCDKIVALDTGLTSVGGTIPTVTGLGVEAARNIVEAAGFVLGDTVGATDRGNVLIGVVASQSPTTGADALGTPVVLTTQEGQLIPTNNDVAIATVIAALDTLGLVLTGVGAALTGTAEADDEKVTITSHGLVNGNRVVLTVGTGGTGYTVGAVYWVVGVAGNDLQLALTEAGAAVLISVDYTVITLREVTDLTYVVELASEALEDVIVSAPAAASLVEYGSAVVLSPRGATVPTWLTGGSGDGGVSDNTELDADLVTAGLIGDGTETSDASTNGTVLALTNHAIGDILAPGQAVEYTYSGT